MCVTNGHYLVAWEVRNGDRCYRKCNGPGSCPRCGPGGYCCKANGYFGDCSDYHLHAIRDWNKNQGRYLCVVPILSGEISDLVSPTPITICPKILL